MSHNHSHTSTSANRAFAVGITLNFGFVIAESLYGVLSHSMALVADAGHNFGDVLGLVLAWGAGLLAKRRPTLRRTYGFRSSTIVASLTNALILLFVTGGIAWESVRRLLTPEPVAGKTVIVVSLIGVAINALSAALFMEGRKKDLNIRSAFLHLASDAVLALGVAIAGIIMVITGWRWLDPAVSLVVSVAILGSTWGLLRESVNLVLGAVPEGIDPDEVKKYLISLPGVLEVHDLHIWAMSTTEGALTVHLVMARETSHSMFLCDVDRELHTRFDIEHSTIQIEPLTTPNSCRLAPADVL